MPSRFLIPFSEDVRMNRFWSLQTKFVVVLVLLMLGALVLQSYVHELNKERLYDQVEALAETIANDVVRGWEAAMGLPTNRRPRPEPVITGPLLPIEGTPRDDRPFTIRGNDSKVRF